MAGMPEAESFWPRVGRDGKVRQVVIMRGPEASIEIAKAATFQCEYMPAIYKGKSVALWIRSSYQSGYGTEQ